MIGKCLASSGLGEFFGQRISVDEVRRPSPRRSRTGTRPSGWPARPAGRIGLVTCKTITSGAAYGSRLLAGYDEGRAS